MATDIFEFQKEGDAIEGEYIGYKKEVGPNKSMMYYLRDSESKEWAVWGSTVIDGQMALVSINSQIRIEFLGIAMGEKKKREYKNFQVSIWEE